METKIEHKTYSVSEQDQQFFTSILLLDNMINRQQYYDVSKYEYLDSAFIKLLSAGRIKLDGTNYVPTEKGREFLQKFMSRYYEYLKVYDVFCGVNLETGEFAFSEYYNINLGEGDSMEEYEKWLEYLGQESFLDLRVAVAEFKKLNPVEIVFMSFINEDRFDVDKDGWEFDVYSGLFWDQITEIVNDSITYAFLDEEGHDMEAIISAGTDVMLELHRTEEEIAEEEARLAEEAAANEYDDDDEYYDDDDDEVVMYVEVIESPYWEYDTLAYYSDPYYVSPVWDPWYDPYYY
jgi:hypothetical protein